MYTSHNVDGEIIRGRRAKSCCFFEDFYISQEVLDKILIPINVEGRTCTDIESSEVYLSSAYKGEIS